MKRCIECGCIMSDDYDGVICEMCVADRGDTIPDHLREDDTT